LKNVILYCLFSLTLLNAQTDQNQSTAGVIHIKRSEISAMPARSLQALLALQPGFDMTNGELFFFGKPAGEMAVYIDETFHKYLNEIGIDFGMPLSAIQEIVIYPGNSSNRLSPGTAGVVQIRTLALSETFNIATDVFQGVGKRGDGVENTLYSYGNQRLGVSLGGPVYKGLKILVSYEQTLSEDIQPSSAPHFSLDRHKFEIDWSKISTTIDPNDGSLVYNGEVWVDGEFLLEAMDDRQYWFFGLVEEQLTTQRGDHYPYIYGQRESSDSHLETMWGFNNLAKKWGSKNNTDYKNQMGFGKLQISIANTDFEAGFKAEETSENFYEHAFSLINTENNPVGTSSEKFLYSRLNSKINSDLDVSMGVSISQKHYRGYVVPDDFSPLSLQLINIPARNFNPNPEIMNFASYGASWDDFHWQKTQRLGVNASVNLQLSMHQLALLLDMNKYSIQEYRVWEPGDLAYELDTHAVEDLTNEQRFRIFRDATTSNLGVDIFGESNQEGNGYQAPGEPLDIRVRVQDKMRFGKTTIQAGLLGHHFDVNFDAPENWDNMWMNSGKIDKETSLYSKVPSQTFFHPQLQVSEQFGKTFELFLSYYSDSRTPAFKDLYLTDTFFANNFTSGHMLIMPNQKLKLPETKTTLFGFQSTLGFIGRLSLSAFMNEHSNMISTQNRFNAKVDGAEYVWSQRRNEGRQTVKGLVSEVSLKCSLGIRVTSSLSFNRTKVEDDLFQSDYYLGWQNMTAGHQYPYSDYSSFNWNSVINYRNTAGPKHFQQTEVSIYHSYLSTSSNAAFVNAYITDEHWGDRTGNTQKIDITMKHKFQLGSVDLSLFGIIYNVLNTQSLKHTYSNNGELLNNELTGWLNTSMGLEWQANNPELLKLLDAYYQDPRYFEPPRLFQLGLQLDL